MVYVSTVYSAVNSPTWSCAICSFQSLITLQSRMMPKTALCCHITPLNNKLGSHPASDRLPTAPQSGRKNLPPPCATQGQAFLYLKPHNARHQQMLLLQQATRVVYIKDGWASLAMEGPTHLMATQYCGYLAVPNFPLMHSMWQRQS